MGYPDGNKRILGENRIGRHGKGPGSAPGAFVSKRRVGAAYFTNAIRPLSTSPSGVVSRYM